jgi:hypothetical protein
MRVSGTLKYCTIIFFVGLLIVSCDNAFNPKGPHEPKVVVYSILSPLEGKQFVRLGLTYDVEGFDPGVHTAEQFIEGASVSMQIGDRTYVFRDTLIQRTDSTRYRGPIKAYVADPFRISPGSSVELFINTPVYGVVRARTSVPGAGIIQVKNSYLLQQSSEFETQLLVLVDIAVQTRGYLLRHYVVYDVLKSGVWVRERREFPVSVVVFAGTNDRIFVYPKLERRSSEPYRENPETETVVVDRLGYLLVVNQIVNQYGSDNVRFRHVVFQLNQVDRHLYSYYNVVNGFQDQYTIRTDTPDYTNIQGGVGVFGAFMVDSVRIPIPERF